MDRFKAICEIVYKCGDIIKNARRDEIGITEKEGEANFVTTYDTMVQNILKKELLQLIPEASFIGEEGDQDAYSDKGIFFIVDPIDGTTNFIKDYHTSCISVAVIEDGDARLGVVYNPYLDEMFTAKRGEGAFLNGREIHVSKEPLENGILLFGAAPYYKELNKISFDMAYKYFQRALDLRRSGSAALDLCSIAAGRAELYFEMRVYPWDYAAGALIVEEAGGVVTTAEGDPFSYDKPISIMARNKAVIV